MHSKAGLFRITCKTMSPVAIPVLPMMADTSSTWPNLEKNDPIRSSLMSAGTPCTVILVFLVPKYSVWSLSDLVVKVFPARLLASSSLPSKISHFARETLASNLGAIFRLFKASSIVSLLTPISVLFLTSDVNREIILTLILFRTSGMARNSSPWRYCSFWVLNSA